MKTTTQIQQFNPGARFLPLNVFQFPLGNCGGITDTIGRESIYIPCENGHVSFEDIQDKNRIFIPEKRGAEYWALKPLIQPTGMNGPMAGGNLAYSSDSRCKVVYHIHDRFEVW